MEHPYSEFDLMNAFLAGRKSILDKKGTFETFLTQYTPKHITK